MSHDEYIEHTYFFIFFQTEGVFLLEVNSDLKLFDIE